MFSEGTTHLPDSAASSATFVRWMVAGVAVVNLFVFGMVVFSLYQSFGEVEERAEITARNLSQMLAQDAAGDIDKIDLMLLVVTDEIERQVASGGIDRQALNAFLARLQGRLPEIFSLRTTDANGIVCYGLGVNPEARQNNSDREYFFRQRDNPKVGLVIAKPVFTRLDKKWAVPMSRAIHLPDGSFGGVVYVNVGLDHLTKTFSAIDVGQRGSVSMRDAELRVFAVYPMPADVDKVIGEKLVVPELQELIRTGRDAGTYITVHTVDGVERKFAARRVPAYPLYIIVGRATEEYMAPWKDQALKTSVLAALFCMTTLISSWLIYRSWRRQVAATLELAREEEKFHTVADYTYDWEYWDGSGHEILFMSPSCEQVTGYSQAEFLAEPELLYRIIHPADLHLMADHRRDAAHQDEAGTDFRIVRRDGEIRWIAHGCRTVFGRDGQLMGRRASNRDITERKHVEDALRRSEARLKDAQRIAHVGNWELDLTQNVLTWSEEIYRMFEIDPRMFIASYEAFLGAIHPDDRDLVNRAYTESVTNHASYDIVHRLLMKDGSIKHVNERCETVYDTDGKPLRSIGTVHDITERKRADDEIRKLNAELEQRVAQRTAQLEAANKELEEFSYSMSHDMRTPLRALDGFSKILLEEHGAGLDDEGKRLLKVLRDNAQRMGRLIDDILRFLSMGRRRMEYSSVDIAKLASEIFTELRAAAPERRLRLEIGALPPTWGDRGMIHQVMQNLLSNAIKFSSMDTEALIELGGVAGEEENVYSVRDHGAGFDMRYADKLFKVFEHVHPPGRYEGTGIGLAIVRRIVERHGGRVWAEGGVGEGATFHFALPKRRQ